MQTLTDDCVACMGNCDRAILAHIQRQCFAGVIHLWRAQSGQIEMQPHRLLEILVALISHPAHRNAGHALQIKSAINPAVISEASIVMARY